MTLDTHHHVSYCAHPAAVAVVGDKGLVLPRWEHEQQVGGHVGVVLRIRTPRVTLA